MSKTEFDLMIWKDREFQEVRIFIGLSRVLTVPDKIANIANNTTNLALLCRFYHIPKYLKDAVKKAIKK